LWLSEFNLACALLHLSGGWHESLMLLKAANEVV
jgi:hypothetical protein